MRMNSIETKLNNKTIHKLFEDQASRTPNHIAVVFKNSQLTYKELNEKANQIARVLLQNNVTKEEIMPVLMDKSIDMIVSILAILKVGGAFLPIDSAYPTERIQYILSDSQSRILLTQNHLVSTVNFDGKIISIDIKELEYPRQNLDLPCESNDLAYVIYTSGSTGKPKGTLLEHKGIANLQLLWESSFKINTEDRIGQFASISFDASIWEIFMALFNGASLFIITKDIVEDHMFFQDYIQQNQINILTLPPTYAIHLDPTKLHKLKLLVTAGSVASEHLVNKWKDHVRYINAYGPTEASICSTVWSPLSENIEQVSIGVPVPNTSIYILNENQEEVNPGEMGELVIEGVGLARGYLNRPELTKEKFIPSPFDYRKKIYKTGDYASLSPDGNIKFHGRIDNQVKIRGHRIEIDEIESSLLKHRDIREAAAVVLDGSDGEKYLCAYYVSEQPIPVLELRVYLERFIPYYMIPSRMVYLERMPLTINGKIDRKKLPDPNWNSSKQLESLLPRNTTEAVMTAIWEEILGVSGIDINDNFYELGGDSIKAIQISAKLLNYNLKLETRELFDHPTIAEVSSSIKNIKFDSNQGIVEGKVGLTPIQHWFFSKRFIEMNQWNQSILLYNPKGFISNALIVVLEKIVEHHDALRMVYKFKDEQVLQYNRGIENPLFNFTQLQIPREEDPNNFILQQIHTMQESMNLTEGPLFQVGLFRSIKGDYLFISIHHLVIDGVSFRILLEDITESYSQVLKNRPIVLPNKTDSFYQWSTELQKYSTSQELINEIPYWYDIEQAATQCVFPMGTCPNKDTQKNKKTINLELTKKHTQQLLRNVHHAYNSEINDILLTSVALASKEWTGHNQVLINLESHGREEIIPNINISRTIGWFTSQCPVILNAENSNQMSDLIIRVKENLRSIPKKGIGYEILKYLTPRHLTSNLDFSLQPVINFNYLGQFESQISSDQNMTILNGILSLGPDGEGNLSENGEMYFNINITSFIENGIFHLNVSYNEHRYEYESMIELATMIIRNLVQIIDHCCQKQEREYTPSDFSHKNLTKAELDNLFLHLSETLN